MEDATLLSILQKVVNGIGKQYTTVSSLQKINDDLDSLPLSEQTLYKEKIISIKSTLNEYKYGNGDETLKDSNTGRLFRQFECYIDSIQKFSDPRLVNYSNYSKKEPGIISIDQVKKDRRNSEKKVVKFDLNDVISSVILNLLGNLNRNVLDSNLTEFIEDYFDIVIDIIQEEPRKYFDITSEIRLCLETHGWKIGHGFQRQPKRLDLVADLELIANKYF